LRCVWSYAGPELALGNGAPGEQFSNFKKQVENVFPPVNPATTGRDRLSRRYEGFGGEIFFPALKSNSATLCVSAHSCVKNLTLLRIETQRSGRPEIGETQRAAERGNRVIFQPKTLRKSKHTGRKRRSTRLVFRDPSEAVRLCGLIRDATAASRWAVQFFVMKGKSFG